MSAPLQSELQAETEARLRFEMLLADVCAQFVNVAVGDIDSRIANAQRVICESLRVDHSSVWQVSDENPDLLDMTHVYRDPNLKPLPIHPNVKEYFPWSSSKVLNKEIVCVPNTATLPPEAEKDKESREQYGIHSSLIIPLSVGGGSVIGILAFDSEREHDWSEPLQRRLQILALVFAQALDRKRAEQKVRESEERLRLAVQAGKMFAYSWDAATDVIERSGESAEILGVKSDQAATGAAISAMVHPDDKQRLEAALSNLKVENPTLQITYRIIHPDGIVKWLERSSRAYFDAQGKLKRIIGMIADVTERKLSEDKLREYERAVEAAEEMIAVVDREYRFLIVNRKYAAMRSMAKEQIVGRLAHEVLSKGVFEGIVKPKLDECFQGKVVRYEMKYTYPELGERDVAVSYFPIEGTAGIEGAACIFQDITERRRAEDALLSSEQRYRLLFERNVAGVGIASPDGKVLDCNDGWARILGYQSREEIRGRLTSEFYFNPAERQPLLDELSEKHVLLSRRMQVNRKDGSPVWVLFNGAELHVGKDTILRQATMIDISEWKRAEEVLSGMTRKLIESQEQERARIGRELHDDINQRLAMLSLELEQLKENPSEVERRVPEIRKSMTDLSNDVQALSHDLHSSKLEYLGVVAGMKSWCKEFAERQRIEIDFSSDVSSVLPLAVGLSLFRVLQEALNNAIKHSGVKRIEMQLREDSGEIHLVISDLGRGFDVEAASQGKGLGLTSMRERVRLVNGTISIESKPMGGTTIHVRIPLEPEHGSQRAAG